MIAQIDSKYQMLGWAKVVRRLTSYGLFEGRPATTKGQFFNPVVFAWLRLLKLIPGQQTVRNPIFITGLGRSGTTVLGMLFSAHRDVGFLNEPKAIWQLICPEHDLNDNYSAGLGQYRLSADANPLRKHIAHRLFGRYLRCVAAKRVVDKYPEMIFRIEFLLSIFPDAKFIFITRDGRSACTSIVKWSQRLGVTVGERVDDWWGRDDAKWRCLREQIIFQDPQYTSVRDIASADLDHQNRAALEWLITMREGLRQQHKYPDRIITVAYEALLDNPDEQLERLQIQCGLAPDPDVISYAKSVLYDNPVGVWPTLHPRIDALFRDTMILLGYPGK